MLRFNDIADHMLEYNPALGGSSTCGGGGGSTPEVSTITPLYSSKHSPDRSPGHSSGQRDSLRTETSLNEDYTFEQYVVGPCNRLSHAAALAIGQNPGRAYNPLFVHGNVGLGKTHLLQSICHAIKRKPEPTRVLYLSCEEFTNKFILAIQTGRLNDFREFYRSADVLVIDDVQFLEGKTKTQEEFFHTFNALYNAHKQIVISSWSLWLDIKIILLTIFWGFVDKNAY